MNRHISVIRFWTMGEEWLPRVLDGLAAYPSRLARDTRGEAIVGFALLMPVLIAVSLAILEFSLVVMDYHRAGEATRAGARHFAISEPVANVSGFGPGSVLTCTSSGTSVTCSGAAAENPAVFNAAVASIQTILPSVTPQNIEVEYRDSGIGDATTPGGIIPVVSVRLINLQRPYTVMTFVPGIPSTITFPTFSTSQMAGGLGPTS